MTPMSPTHHASSRRRPRADRERDADEAVAAELQQHAGQDHADRRRGLDVGVRQPRVQRDDRHLDREAEEQQREDRGTGTVFVQTGWAFSARSASRRLHARGEQLAPCVPSSPGAGSSLGFALGREPVFLAVQHEHHRRPGLRERRRSRSVWTSTCVAAPRRRVRSPVLLREFGAPAASRPPDRRSRGRSP